jgi:hypothetical protein
MTDRELLRIRVDFNTMMMDVRGRRVWINTDIQPELLKVLKPGMHVVLYEPSDMEVEAVVEFEQFYCGGGVHDRWLGLPDWSTRQDLTSGNHD